jgi:hypothetical protein
MISDTFAPQVRFLVAGVPKARTALCHLRAQHQEVLIAADRRVLVEHCRDEIEKAAKLIGRNLSAWLR